MAHANRTRITYFEPVERIDPNGGPFSSLNAAGIRVYDVLDRLRP